MRTILSIILLLMFCQTTYAQRERNVILTCGIKNVAYTAPPEKKKTTASSTVGQIIGSVLEAAAGANSQTEAHPEYIDQIRAAIVGGIGNSRRVNVVDAQFDDVVDSGCDLYIDGNIGSISTTRHLKVWTDDKKKEHEDVEYKGNITGTINIKVVGTDEVVKSLNINTASYTFNWVATADDALGNCVRWLTNWLTSTANNIYPLYASIVEGSSAKKDKQKEVYIDLGEPDGVYKGMHFNVYKVGQVAGKETKKQVGKLRVTEVQGDEISLCKVTSGGADIKEALDSGAELVITSVD